ncbi:hypothetical protein B0O80DRAFT_425464 [Mortierella sp. GBAus27b]|nr:hypothetical protein BGX31_007463 [Mortierella sp. GBA43]KAI8355782.1 hypothetical protein B0O80DRAFT_425464 [Mortierella sp. GBAus27b]
MERSYSTPSPARYSTSSLSSITNGHSNTTVHSHHRRDWEKSRSYDSELDHDDKFKKSRAPSPHPSDRIPGRRFNRKTCIFTSALVAGILVSVWVISTGAITLDSFNELIRYLPGYKHFANNLLYLVVFLLFVSFTVLAILPIPSIFVLGLPFHFLVISIFKRLMYEWSSWIIGCYVALSLAPIAFTIHVRIRSVILQNSRLEIPTHRRSPSSNFSSLSPSLSPSTSRSPSPSPVHIKYSPLNHHHGLASGNSSDSNNSSSFFGSLKSYAVATLYTLDQKLGSALYIFSVSNRTSTRWRLLLGLGLWLSYVVPISITNESRYFDPTLAAPSFDILRPEPLCSADYMEGKPRHDSFDGYWEEYLDLHRQMILPEEEGGIPNDQKQFLVFQTSDDGLGNRLQALLSTVVLAMVTKRAIVLDWMATPQCNANFTDLFQQPENLQWDISTLFPERDERPEYYWRYQLWYAYCRGCAIRDAINPKSPWSSLLCEADLGIYKTSPVVQVTSTHWFLPVIQHNPHWRQELCHMFPNSGQNAFQLLAAKLLKPSVDVQQKIDSVLKRVPDDVTLIGLQVRRTENNAVDYGVEDAFLRCADEIAQREEDKFLDDWRMGIVKSRIDDMAQVLDRIKGRKSMTGDEQPITEEKGSKDSGLALRSSRPRSQVRRPKFAYFLATDYRPTRAHFQKALGDSLFVLDNTFNTHKSSPSPSKPSSLIASPLNASGINSQLDPMDNTATVSSSKSSREAVVRNSIDGVQTATAEMFLLAQSDRIVSSPYSTFGYFAHAYANVQPTIVKRDGTCLKRRSTQPCFQYWFGFANGGATCSIRSTVEMSEDYDCWL